MFVCSHARRPADSAEQTNLEHRTNEQTSRPCARRGSRRLKRCGGSSLFGLFGVLCSFVRSSMFVLFSRSRVSRQRRTNELRTPNKRTDSRPYARRGSRRLKRCAESSLFALFGVLCSFVLTPVDQPRAPNKRT